jgi:DEAD/DEAH box helicase domain-containing protein
MNADAFLEYINSSPEYNRQIVHVQYIPAQSARFGELEKTLNPSLQSRLESAGITSLYTHQATAVNKALAGQNIIVSTPSASGKTLCYNIPVLESLINDRSSRALYLFPTKALAQDQLRSFNQLACPELIGYGECTTFDGDTPQYERGQIKKKAKVVLSNPDMLHVGILPNHKTWSRMFSELKYIVIDEAHVYRGVFGSHVASVIRRLRRICQSYGSKPQFICCSATIANPGEHAEALVGETFQVVDNDGSPHGKKQFIFWNPPILDEAKSTRGSSNSEATVLFTELVRNDIRSLVFTRTRKLTELVYMYSRDRLGLPLADRIKPYRAGYLPEDRRQIESELFSGSLLGAVATNALELGIDIGDLDATVLTGYPGSIASTWQQAGRSGRRRDGSLSFLIAQDNPLDQYFMNNPDYFFGKNFENALINAQNLNILKPHLLCAAWEKPLSKGDSAFFGDAFFEALVLLEKEKGMKKGKELWYLSPRISHPTQHVNIRSTSDKYYAILDASQGYQLLETIEASTAFFQVHQGAIYLHQGEPYLIEELDLDRSVAIVRPANVPYYTQAKDITEISVKKVKREVSYADVKVCFGEVDVTTEVLGFRKKMQFTDEVVGDELLDLPPQCFNTEAVWFNVPQKAIDKLVESSLDVAGGLHAAEHASIALLPLFALCDRNDIGGVSTPFHPDTGRPQIFIYDAYPGGIGIAEKGYEVIARLWATTLKAIEDCPCQDGCPSCIQSPKCGNNNEPLDKRAAIALLRGLVLTQSIK